MMTIFRSIFCPKKKDENGICRDCYPKKNLEKRRKCQDIAKKIIQIFYWPHDYRRKG